LSKIQAKAAAADVKFYLQMLVMLKKTVDFKDGRLAGNWENTVVSVRCWR
jgi:hypothetical protein